MDKTIYVSKNKNDSNVFSSINDAVNSIPKDNQTPVTIVIAPGIYREKVTIDRPFLSIEGSGESNKDTVITYDDYANFIMEDGMKRGTFRSYTAFIDAHDVTLKNLTIENASGDSVTHGQAIALYADGDRLVIDSCNIIGHQDTLFTGPLPPKEAVKDGFIGPKQFAPRIHGRQYYKDCYICGDVDFIFGGATAYFENCTIESLRRFSEDDRIQGYVTAASTPEEEEYGYVFSECRIISGECPQGSVYLGRPWRNYAKTIFINCDLGAHIRPELFHDWNKEDARETIFYGIYRDDVNEDFSKRADFVRKLDKEQVLAFSKEKVLAGKDGWQCRMSEDKNG
ncbi:MAG: pectin methylesterase [Lachnospiraceae bacterium]|nr:pectin methylesterase [Lachnospiraceae bacterium]